jgi:hypothetical protein
MDILSDEGRTSAVCRLRTGFVCKIPRTKVPERLRSELKNAFAVEKGLLERLGDHPGIVKYAST